MIEPEDATCGTVPERSQIYRGRQNPDWELEEFYKLATCASDCGRKYPQNHAFSKLPGSEDGVQLGQPDCLPYKTLPVCLGKY